MRARGRLRLVLLSLFFAAVASGQPNRPPRGGGGPGPGPGQPQGPGGGRPAPPQFAVDACRGSSEGSACTAQTPRGERSGSCASINGTLACIPGDDRPGPARTTRIAPESVSAPAVPTDSAPIPEATPAPALEEAAAPASALAPAAAPASAPEAPAAAPSLLPLIGLLAAAAALFFGLWKFIATLKAEPPITFAPAASAPVIPPPAAGPNGGTLIGGNYETRRELGAGGMGVVFEAHDLALDRRVALKKMRAEIGRSPRDRERFLSEARMVAKLQHPNIVGIHAIVEDSGDLYLVFEYVDGITLDELIQREKFIPPQRALEILSGVAAAVDHAHNEKVIHRDLKPANIMIDKAGRPKVMDFGIAHQAKLTISRLTRAEAYGTLAYMPPEQELGQAVRESDIYAFAAVTYEALTGGLPFPGPNFHLQKASMTFLRPSQADPTLPHGVDAVFERAFQPEPKSRHPTTGEFVRALDGALARKRA